MVTSKVETKVVLLLTPGELDGKFMLLGSMHIRKSAKGITYEETGLRAKELAKNYGYLPGPAKELLQHFSPEAFATYRVKLKETQVGTTATQAEKSLLDKATLRRFHQLFDQLKPFLKLLKWYHKSGSAKNRLFTISPCSFSQYKPRLQFHVSGKNGQLILQTEVLLNETSYNLKEFSRHHFLLENSNEYFLLSYREYQVLEWLIENKPEQYSTDPNAFAQHILAKLEADYPVNRNNLFTKKAVTVLPLNRVLLSELNGSFLMLTPQWIYDGFIVENPWSETYETTIEGEGISVVRNQAAEEELVKMLVTLHPNFANQKNGYYYLSFADAQKKQWFPATYHHLLQAGIELAGIDMLQHFRYSPFAVQTRVKIEKEAGSKVTMQLTVMFDKEEIKLAELQKMLLAGQKAVLLKDGSLGILNDEWLQQYGAIIKHGRINKDEIEVARFMAITEQQSTVGRRCYVRS